MIIAPVRVAKSIITLGLNRLAYCKTSHNTNRPSASVFKISMVLPAILVTTSPGFNAAASGIFSQLPITAVTLIGKAKALRAAIAPITDAAPHISYFISSIDAPGFNEMPPLSKVNPLPTNTIGASPSTPPLYSIVINLASSDEPLATPQKAPMPSACISAPPLTSTLTFPPANS